LCFSTLGFKSRVVMVVVEICITIRKEIGRCKSTLKKNTWERSSFLRVIDHKGLEFKIVNHRFTHTHTFRQTLYISSSFVKYLIFSKLWLNRLIWISKVLIASWKVHHAVGKKFYYYYYYTHRGLNYTITHWWQPKMIHYFSLKIKFQ
jgi:hypothetical protein